MGMPLTVLIVSVAWWLPDSFNYRLFRQKHRLSLQHQRVPRPKLFRHSHKTTTHPWLDGHLFLLQFSTLDMPRHGHGMVKRFVPSDQRRQ